MATHSRRSFIRQSALVGAAAGLPSILKASDNLSAEKISNDAVILFQGDSITDGNRTRDNDWNHVMGHGYACLIASRLWFDHPDKKFHFFNRGISGNKIPDLTARWQTDTLDIKPNLLSILIGVNDSLGAIMGDPIYTPENYESGYHALLKQTKEALPNIKLVICEPFILPVGKVKDNWDKWKEVVTTRQAIAKKLSEEFDAIFVDFQDEFNKALSKAPADYWIWDGVHPMPGGHELMARHWLKVVNKTIKLA
ncbi:SGNH/GDSL hydrolase family protein [Inquilinus sp. KBS0705]|nr:SGNH/GDSL hydrolase family protein [Inquilinus sp. KBS0705]